ncbi:MAG: peptidylprolyl isomerase [Qingshengfaniella sp.]
MLKALIAGLVLVTGPVWATGLDIEVAGEATGTIHIELYDDVAPGHVARLTDLARAGAYDGVVFHRVIDGFMAQTGDVAYGNSTTADFDLSRVGFGGSDMPDLKAEFSDRPFLRGVVGMARSKDHDSANSQFFIMFTAAPHLDGDYTVVGQVTSGMEVVDAIKRSGTRGSPPDRMVKVTVTE